MSSSALPLDSLGSFRATGECESKLFLLLGVSLISCSGNRGDAAFLEGLADFDGDFMGLDLLEDLVGEPAKSGWASGDRSSLIGELTLNKKSNNWL